MATPLQNVNFKIGDSFETLLDMVYPVGSVYLSVVDASPASFLGGDWSKIGEGRCLAGAGTGATEQYYKVDGTKANFTPVVPLDAQVGSYQHLHVTPTGMGVNGFYLTTDGKNNGIYGEEVTYQDNSFLLLGDWNNFHGPYTGYVSKSHTTSIAQLPQVYGVNIYKRIA